MRVLLAPDCFTGTLTAPEAVAALREGWSRGAPGDDPTGCPLSDGGPGFLDVLAGSLGGSRRAVEVPGPLGDPVSATVLLTPDAGEGVTGYVEAAEACGLHLVPPEHRDPTRTTSYGVGVLIHAAVRAGARRVVVGVGGTATNDGGAGMIAALDDAASGRAVEVRAGRGLPAAGPDDRLAAGGGALLGCRPQHLGGLARARDLLAGVDLVAATDVDSPLLGFHGASAVFAPQKGASPEQAQHLERALGDFAAAAARVGGLPTDLLTGRPADPARRPGAGAGGGLGFGLVLLGAVRVPGAVAVADAVGLRRLIAASDLVVTGEGCLDVQSLRGKVVSGVAAAALEAAVPVVAIAGRVELGRRELRTAGIASAYPLAATEDESVAALRDPAGVLAAVTARVARTWSR